MILHREALHKSNELIRSIVSNKDDIFFTLDMEERHTGFFSKWIDKSGLTKENFIGKTSLEILGEGGAIHSKYN